MYAPTTAHIVQYEALLHFEFYQKHQQKLQLTNIIGKTLKPCIQVKAMRLQSFDYFRAMPASSYACMWLALKPFCESYYRAELEGTGQAMDSRRQLAIYRYNFNSSNIHTFHFICPCSSRLNSPPPTNFSYLVNYL